MNLQQNRVLIKQLYKSICRLNLYAQRQIPVHARMEQELATIKAQIAQIEKAMKLPL